LRDRPGVGNGEKDAQEDRFESDDEIEGIDQEEGRNREKQRKVAAKKPTSNAKKSPAAKKAPIATKAPVSKKAVAGKKIRKPVPKSFIGKVEGAITAIVDTITDAERLHHQLDPGVSREPE